jgi:hypothetical protein
MCSVSKKKGKSNTVINNLCIDGKPIRDKSVISNSLNDFYCNLGADLVKALPTLPNGITYANYMHPSIRNSMFCEDTNISEMSILIASLNGAKSCGPDDIGPQLIKDNNYLFCQPLTFLFNLSLSKGVVPDALKVAKVIPLFKKGDEAVMANYRPISLLSIFNKLLEKLVFKRIASFVDANNIMYKYQFGFRKHHSTSLALLDVIDGCYKNIDMNNKVIGIYFDLQKAFDTVDHTILLHKLYNYGIRGVMFDWIKNYLTNRKQYTYVNNTSSSLSNVTFGVPQGSVLGPLLFTLYINDISNSVTGDKLKLFADDTNLFISGPDITLLETEANDCLKKMELWFIANKLSLNTEKTCYMIFTKNKHPISITLAINNYVIKRVNNCKYLGVIIDDCLKWEDHIDMVYKKIVKFIGIFYKIRNLLPPVCLRNMYYSFVHPHIIYGIEVYANASKMAIDRLCKLNNKILRILLMKRTDTPTIQLYKAYNTLPYLCCMNHR